MADGILRHGGLPFVDARKQRFGIEGNANDLPQFVANDFENFFFARFEDLLVARAAEKAADEGAIFRCTMRKFVVDEGGREHTMAFTARHQESEAWWKRAPHFFVVTERDGHRRTVPNLAQIAGQVLIRTLQHGRSGLRWGRDDHGVEVVALVFGRNNPAVVSGLRDHRLHGRRRL